MWIRSSPTLRLVLLVSTCLASSVACHDPGGDLRMRVAFPRALRVATIPAEATEIRLLLTNDFGFRRITRLTRTQTATRQGGLPPGTMTVAAVAVDGNAKPLVGNSAQVRITAGETTSVTLDLSPTRIPAELLATLLAEPPAPTSSGTPTVGFSTAPSSAAVSGGDGPVQPPVTSSGEANSASSPPSAMPSASPAATGGGGSSGGAAPPPGQSSGTVTVTPGGAYTGPVILIPAPP